MSFAIVQNTNSANGTSPVTAVFTSTPIAGNLLLVSTQTGSTTPTVVDGNSNAFTLLGSITNGTHSGYLFGLIATASQSKSITVTQGTTTTVVNLYELSGGPTSLIGVVDAVASFHDASSTATTSGSQPSVSTTNPNDLLWTSVFVAGTVTSPSVSQGTLEQHTPTGAITTVDMAQVLTTTGTYTPSFSWTSSHSWSQLTLAISPTAGSPPTGNLIDTTTDFQGIFPSGAQRKIIRNSSNRIFTTIRIEDAGLSTYEPYVCYSDNGSSWTPVEIATITTDHQRVGSLAVGSDDVIHLAWYGKDPSNTGTNQRQIKYAHSTNAGVTWSSWVSIGGDVTGYTSSTLWQEHPMIAVDPANASNLYVVWEGRDSTNTNAQQVKFSKSTNGGTTWSAWTNIFTDASNSSSRPTVVITGDGTVHVAFYSTSGTTGAAEQILHISSTDGGTTWSGATILSGDNGYDSRDVCMIADGSQLHVVWRAPNVSFATPQINYSKFGGSTWSAAAAVAPSSGNYQFAPQIGKINGILAVLWSETSNSSSYPSEAPTTGTIKWTTNTGSGWSAEASLTSGTTDIYPNINATKAEFIYLTNSSTPYDVQYVTVTMPAMNTGAALLQLL